VLKALYRYRRAGIGALFLAAIMAILSFLITAGWIGGGLSLKILFACMTVWFIAIALYALLRAERMMSVTIQHMDRSAMMRLERMARSTDPGSSQDYLYLKARLDEEKARVDRHGGVMSLLYVEPSDHEHIKKQYGEKVCEEVFDQLGETFAAHLRQFDALRRIEHNRYLILLPQTSRRDARTVAESLCRVVAGYSYDLPAGGRVDDLALKVGIAAYPINGDSTENVVAAAHNAVRVARRDPEQSIVVSEEFIRTDSSGEEVVSQVQQQSC
jgi:diguanylate cyclase (GGDEF)-like protein